MSDYYKKIKGKKYDKKLIAVAESLIRGKGDGRLSLQDSKKILHVVKDSNDYTDIEKNTMRYIRDHFAFTPEADAWFRSEIRSWAALKGANKKTTVKTKKTIGVKKTKKPKAPIIIENIQNNDEETPSMPLVQESSLNKKPLSNIILVIITLIFLFIIIFLVSPPLREKLISLFDQDDIQIEKEVMNINKIPSAIIEKDARLAQKQGKPQAQDAGAQYYTVQAKDDLVSISEKVMKNYAKWVDLYNANRNLIKNPNIIFPGQKLKLPKTKIKETIRQK